MRLSGSVKLRCARSGGPPSAPRCGLPLFIIPEDGPGSSSSSGGLLGLGFEEGFGGADALEPCRFVGDPVGHLIAALIASVGTILRRIGRLGLRQPGRDLRGKTLLGLAPCGHTTSPCARWRSPQSCCRPAPHARASPALPLGTT